MNYVVIVTEKSTNIYKYLYASLLLIKGIISNTYC